MTYPPYLRLRARELRISRQLTLDELVQRLALPRTTVYHWIRDLPLERPRDGSAAQRKGTRAMQAKYRRLREEAYRQGLEEYPALVQLPTFRDFVVLYIAEGYKRSRNTASLCNSDPQVVALALRWMSQLSGRDPTVRIAHHLDQDRGLLLEFWSDALNISQDRIRFEPKTNSSELKSRTWRCAHGVGAVDIHNTVFRARLQAWIDHTKSTWPIHSR